MFFTKELGARPDFKVIENLLSEVHAFFKNHGILHERRKPARVADENVGQKFDSQDWLKDFAVKPDNQAFYLTINSRDNLKEFHHDFVEKLTQVSKNIDEFAKNNADVIDEEAKKKINGFKKSLSLAQQKAIRVRSLTKVDFSDCNDISEIRERAGKHYVKFLHDDFFATIMEPLYEGMRKSPSALYEQILKFANNFIAALGISTVEISVGEKISDNDLSLYTFSEEKNYTSDESKKDEIIAVNRYAYVFNDGKQNPCVYEGEVAVLIYKR